MSDEVNEEMDREINTYLDAVDKHLIAFYAYLGGDKQAFESVPKNGDPLCQFTLWFKGSEKWGRPWALREYDLRVRRQNSAIP